MNKIAKFNIGDFVIHIKQGYHAVIVDADPIFRASGRFNPQSLTREFSTKTTWYRLLVDDSNLVTYVEEAALRTDEQHQHINNPHVAGFLTHRAGHYESLCKKH